MHGHLVHGPQRRDSTVRRVGGSACGTMWQLGYSRFRPAAGSLMLRHRQPPIPTPSRAAHSSGRACQTALPRRCSRADRFTASAVWHNFKFVSSVGAGHKDTEKGAAVTIHRPGTCAPAQAPQSNTATTGTNTGPQTNSSRHKTPSLLRGNRHPLRAQPTAAVEACVCAAAQTARPERLDRRRTRQRNDLLDVAMHETQREQGPLARQGVMALSGMCGWGGWLLG
jgi:hypothetical protein